MKLRALYHCACVVPGLFVMLIRFPSDAGAAGPVVWSVNGHTYEAVPAQGISYAAARTACFDRGGYLATITSAEEEAFVENLIGGDISMWEEFPRTSPSCCVPTPENPNCVNFSCCSCLNHFSDDYGPWFGGLQNVNSPEPAGGWRWRSFEPWGYIHWYPGQPNNFGPGGEFLAKFFRTTSTSDSTGLSVATTGWDDVSNAITSDKIPGYIFESSTCSSSLDADGDGLPDCWEEPADPAVQSLNGVPIPLVGCNHDVNQPCQYQLYRLVGSNPRHKDLFVEADALLGRGPSAGALQSVVQAFAAAPVSNPDNINGIHLHIVGQGGDPAIDEFDGAAVDWANIWVDFDAHRTSHFGTSTERADLNWSNLQVGKGMAYRYCVFAQTYGGTTSSGLAKVTPGRDFMVTLGAFVPTNAMEEAGTFMHELGHTLGLRHGGGDDIDEKPNYLSVMNPLWQMPVRIGSGCGNASTTPLQAFRNSWRLDYSAIALPSLDETSLSERAGIGGDPSLYVPVGPPNGSALLSDIVSMGGPVNWDRAGSASATNVQADVNYVPDCSANNSPSWGETMNGFDDWTNLLYAVPPPGPAQVTRDRIFQQGDELALAAFQDLGTLQLDCNGNGHPDQQDIALGSSEDANSNGVPDECDAAVTAVEGSTHSAALSMVVHQNPMLRGAPMQVEFTVPRTGTVRLAIYDATGARVANLLDTEMSAGTHVVPWGGMLAHGRPAPGGMYFLTLAASGSKAATKLIVLP